MGLGDGAETHMPAAAEGRLYLFPAGRYELCWLHEGVQEVQSHFSVCPVIPARDLTHGPNFLASVVF